MNMEQLQKENEKLRAYVERLHAAFIPFMSKKQIAVDGVVMVPQITYNKWVEALSEKPAQSLNHIMAKVEEDTIWRCELQVRKEWQMVALNGNNYCLRQLPRKYSNKQEAVAKDGE